MAIPIRIHPACLIAILGSVLIAPTATADVLSTLTTAQPTANGGITLTILDTNGQLSSTPTINGILATDTPAQKATKIAAGINAQLTADGAPIDTVFSAAAAGNVVTVTKMGGGGMTVTVNADTTGEGTKLKSEESGGNGENWFWRAVRYFFASNDPIIPPPGDTYTVTLTNGDSATVVTDGIETVGQLQDSISLQFASQGIIFTQSTDPMTGAIILTSQDLPVGLLFPPGGVGVDSSAGYSDFLGGLGVTLAGTPEPSSLALLATGLASTLLAFHRKHHAPDAGRTSTTGKS